MLCGAPGAPDIEPAAPQATSNPIPIYDGILYANPPSLLFPFQTDALGRFETTISWPPAPAGTDFYLQVGVIDPAAASGVALSNALRGVTQ